MSNSETRYSRADFPAMRKGAEDAGAELLTLGRRLVTADASAVWWRLSDGDEWHVLSSHGFSQAFPTGVRLGSAATGVVKDLADCSGGDELTAYRKEGMRSLLRLAVPVRGEACGALVFGAREPSRFGASELEAAHCLVGPAGRVLSAVELEAEQTARRVSGDSSDDGAASLADTSRQQRSLYEAAERLASIVAYSDDAIVSKDLDGVVQTWNHAAERIFGYSAAEMIGQPIARIVPPDRPEEEPRILERLRRGERIDHFETVRMRKDGQLIDISVTISPLRNASGTIVGASKIARDITERRRLEQELQLRAEELQAQREELEMQNEELFAQNETLARADAAKNEFVAMLAHELRNPLAPIRNAMYLLGSRIPDEPAVLRHRQTIERQLRHLSQLVEDLLEASRVSRGIVTLRREVLDLVQVAGSAADALADFVAERGHRLSVRVPNRSVLVLGDALRLEQVILNLLNNAAKFTDPGGSIELYVESDGTAATIRVRDNGIGVPPALLTRIFDLFAQGDQGLARERGGLGIGLNVVRNLVEMHDGSVEAFSKGPGCGTEVIVTLPLVVREPPMDAPETPLRPRRRFAGPLHQVLVVDDSRDAADTLAELLREWGKEVRVTYSGTSALQLAAAETPDLMFVDIGMPEMDGYEVARKVRARPGGEVIRLVALTGYGGPNDRERARDAGFDDHLTKPVDPEELRRYVTGADS